jgi:hypothetical protein
MRKDNKKLAEEIWKEIHKNYRFNCYDDMTGEDSEDTWVVWKEDIIEIIEKVLNKNSQKKCQKGNFQKKRNKKSQCR